MQISEVTQVASNLLAGINRNQKPGQPGSILLDAVEELRTYVNEDADSYAFRSQSLRTAHNRLRDSHYDMLAIQTERSVYQAAVASLSTVRGDIEEIESLVREIESGDFSASQRKDARNIISLRIERINEVLSGASFAGESLFSGESFRITTDAVTLKGFTVDLDELGISELGLDYMDVVNYSADDNLTLLSVADYVLEEYEAVVEEKLGYIESVMESSLGNLKDAFGGLISSEKMGVGEETRWLEEARDDGVVVDGLRGLVSSSRLEGEAVSGLLQ